MATPLRYAVTLLVWGVMAVIWLPLVPAAFTLITPAFSATHWLALFSDPSPWRQPARWLLR